MGRTIALVVLLALSGATSAKEAPLRTELRALQFNNAAEQYIERQTMVTVSGKGAKQQLNVRFAPYGAPIQMYGGPLFQFRVGAVNDYTAHIDKYLRWSSQAIAHGDAFTKEIGRAKSSPGLSLKFVFHSGNASKHFLEVTVCSLGNCSVFEPLYLDIDGAEELKTLLLKLQAGELPGHDVGANYQ